jgi:hypothetical protein
MLQDALLHMVQGLRIEGGKTLIENDEVGAL